MGDNSDGQHGQSVTWGNSVQRVWGTGGIPHMGHMGNGGTRGMGHMGNVDTGGNGVLGVWDTRPVRPTGAKGYRGYGAHRQ